MRYSTAARDEKVIRLLKTGLAPKDIATYLGATIAMIYGSMKRGRERRKIRSQKSSS